MKKEIIGNILVETPLLWRCQIEKDEIGMAMESGPKIAAIVLQYGQWQKTLACVQSLIQGELVPHWIIVVDNASPDDSASQISCSLKKTVGNAYWQAD